MVKKSCEKKNEAAETAQEQLTGSILLQSVLRGWGSLDSRAELCYCKVRESAMRIPHEV